MKLLNTICPFCKQLRKVVDGRELRELRIKNKMSLRQLGRQLSLSAAYLCDIEHNRRLAPRGLINYWKRRITSPILI